MKTAARRPATWDDLTVGAPCFKGNGPTAWVVTNRGESYNPEAPGTEYDRPWVSVAKATSHAARAAQAGQPQRGGTMLRLDTFTVLA